MYGNGHALLPYEHTCDVRALFEEDAAGGADALRHRITDKLRHHIGHGAGVPSERDWFVATALAMRDAVVGPWLDSTQRAAEAGAKRVYYLSLEFLPGRMLLDAAGNLGLAAAVRDALAAIGVDPDRVLEQEPDPALGNGGLGRLAACFMESMATLGIPAIGYGIRYEQGLFRQVFEDGVQKELPDDWLALGNPWEFARPALAYPVGFGGEVTVRAGRAGARPHGLGTRRVFVRRRLRHAHHRRLPRRAGRPPRDNPAAVVRPRRLAAPPRRFQPRRPCRRAPRAGAPGSGLARALPRRRIAGGAGIAVAAAILLRHRLLAGPAAPPPRPDARPPLAPRKGGDPAQRHASRHGRRGAHAIARGPARDGVGRGVAGHRGHHLLHQPHLAAGSAGDLAGCAGRASASPAPPDHLPPERRAPGARARAKRRRTTPSWRPRR